MCSGVDAGLPRSQGFYFYLFFFLPGLAQGLAVLLAHPHRCFLVGRLSVFIPQCGNLWQTI